MVIHEQVSHALARLITIAKSDTGQARRVAKFLFSWWNADDLGGFDLIDLCNVDEAISHDMVTIFRFLAQHHGAIYADAWGRGEDMADLVELWRPVTA